MRPASERRRYIVTSSLTGWTQCAVYRVYPMEYAGLYCALYWCGYYRLLRICVMHSSTMTSSNGKIVRGIGPSWGNPPATGGFPSQPPVMWSYDIFFDLHLNKRLSKQSRRRWFETSLRSLWRHCNVHIHQINFTDTAKTYPYGPVLVKQLQWYK